MRTICELAAMKDGFSDVKAWRQSISSDGTEHDALDDVKNQIKCVSVAWDKLLQQEGTK